MSANSVEAFGKVVIFTTFLSQNYYESDSCHMLRQKGQKRLSVSDFKKKKIRKSQN